MCLRMFRIKRKKSINHNCCCGCCVSHSCLWKLWVHDAPGIIPCFYILSSLSSSSLSSVSCIPSPGVPLCGMNMYSNTCFRWWCHALNTLRVQNSLLWYLSHRFILVTNEFWSFYLQEDWANSLWSYFCLFFYFGGSLFSTSLNKMLFFIIIKIKNTRAIYIPIFHIVLTATLE